QGNVFFFRALAQGQVFLDRNGDGVQGRTEAGVPGVTVELLKEGEVVATTRTDRQGRDRFTQFPETGDYPGRVVVAAGVTATTTSPLSFLVSAGDTVVRNLNFGIRSVAPGTASLSTTPAVAQDGMTAAETSTGARAFADPFSDMAVALFGADGL